MRTVSTIPVKIANRSKVRIYTGTAERIGQLIWFEKDKILKEESEYHARIKLDSPLVAVRNDAFLIRLHSPLITLSGGIILEVNPPKIQHREDDWLSYFKLMASPDNHQIIHTIIARRNLNAVSKIFIQQKLFQPEFVISPVVDNLIKQKKIRSIKIKGLDHYISTTSFDQLADAIQDIISRYHQSQAHLPGLNHQELFDGSGYAWISPEIFDAAIKKLLNSNIIKLEKNYYSLADFKIQVSKDMNMVQKDILQILKDARFSPLTADQISQKIDLPLAEVFSILTILVNSNKLIAINRDIFIEQTVWDELLLFLRKYFDNRSEMPVVSLKEFINTTRKYAIPIFEYLDSKGITIREGDVRKKGHNL